jgi:hypothetical protein
MLSSLPISNYGRYLFSVGPFDVGSRIRVFCNASRYRSALDICNYTLGLRSRMCIVTRSYKSVFLELPDYLRRGTLLVLDPMRPMINCR